MNNPGYHQMGDALLATFSPSSQRAPQSSNRVVNNLNSVWDSAFAGTLPGCVDAHRPCSIESLGAAHYRVFARLLLTLLIVAEVRHTWEIMLVSIVNSGVRGYTAALPGLVFQRISASCPHGRSYKVETPSLPNKENKRYLY
jgi:hypothetical protein